MKCIKSIMFSTESVTFSSPKQYSISLRFDASLEIVSKFRTKNFRFESKANITKVEIKF